MRSHKIELLLESRRLVEQESLSEDVVTLWDKAVSNAKDAQIPEMSLDGAIQSAYTAALNGCLAFLALKGLRTTTGTGHHEMTFYAVAAHAIPGLEDLVVGSEEVRLLRKGSLYDPVIATETDRTKVVAWTRDLMPKLRAALVTDDSALDSRLATL
jgi:hypothetical protein